MRYSVIGEDLVPLIGQGGSIIGEDPSINYDRILKTGIDNGLTFIDTAEVYTGGESEKIIGRAISKCREKVFICTKVSPNHLLFNDIISSADNSLRRLNIDTIDLYKIHWPNNLLCPDDILRAFDDLHRHGKVRYFGVSNFLPMDFEKFNTKDTRFGSFVSNQIEYNLFDRFAEIGIIPYFKNKDVKIIAYSPLNRGNICSDSEEILKELSAKYHKTPAQISLNWLASHDIISVPFSSNIDHIVENATSCDFEIDEQDMDLINKEVKGKLLFKKVSEIQVAKNGFGGHKVYNTKEEALENRYNFCPSPRDISDYLLSLSREELNYIKPVRVMDENGVLNLIEGRVRYWGWNIAFGDDILLPVYIVKKG
jgi:diketogulonate reductase-like aldo/keto reductase